MRKAIKIILFLLLLALLYFAYGYYQQLGVVTTYNAKIACTCIYEGNRSLENVQENELGYFPISLASIDVDKTEKSVTASVFGMKKARAVYKPGVGCVRVYGKDDFGVSLSIPSEPSSLGLLVDDTNSNADLKKIADGYFQDEATKTRTILVLKNDTILYERYGEGLTESTPQLGWSMTKSITNALVGIVMKKGLINVNKGPLFPEWENDERKRITLQHLLQMNSGLNWEEDYESISDATQMLFLSEDMMENMLDNKAEFPPTMDWEYSSGSTNLILGYLRNLLGDEVYHNFPEKELFSKLGMSTAFIETDEAGNFIGSSFGYASGRDWARFGLMYLNEGMSQDSIRILPEDWVNYTGHPVSSSILYYGSQWWLNDKNCQFKDVPSDLFYASGYQGQYVFVIPTEDLVVVRLGMGDDLDINSFLKDIIASLK
jgi:CubicO group peptidase (beta-lactamase class C family)